MVRDFRQARQGASTTCRQNLRMKITCSNREWKYVQSAFGKKLTDGLLNWIIKRYCQHLTTLEVDMLWMWNKLGIQDAPAPYEITLHNGSRGSVSRNCVERYGSRTMKLAHCKP